MEEDIGTANQPQAQPISCKKPLPDLPDLPIELAEEIKRYKTITITKL